MFKKNRIHKLVKPFTELMLDEVPREFNMLLDLFGQCSYIFYSYNFNYFLLACGWIRLLNASVTSFLFLCTNLRKLSFLYSFQARYLLRLKLFEAVIISFVSMISPWAAFCESFETTDCSFICAFIDRD